MLRKKLAAIVQAGFRKGFPKRVDEILGQCSTSPLYIKEITRSLLTLQFCHCLVVWHTFLPWSPAALKYQLFLFHFSHCTPSLSCHLYFYVSLSHTFSIISTTLTTPNTQLLQNVIFLFTEKAIFTFV